MGRILGIDPSSSAVGYALLSGLAPQDVIDAGVLWPESPAKFVKSCRDEMIPLADRFRRSDLAAVARSLSLAHAIRLLFEELGLIDAVIVEVPSGRAGTGSRRGASSSLASYGLAAGVILRECKANEIGAEVFPVSEREWIASSGSKPKRIAHIRNYYPSYDASKDPGGDCADAIGLARWGLLNLFTNTRGKP